MKLLKRRKFVNHKKRIMYFSLFFMLLFISVGYAYLNATLSINGHTEIATNTWNIHFENLAVTDGSVVATTPAAINNNLTSIGYSILLEHPGDFYEFEVDVVNTGTVAGKVDLSNVEGLSAIAQDYVECSVKYTNGNPVLVDDLLKQNTRKRIVVRVTYKMDIGSFPDSNLVLDLVYKINYVQTYTVTGTSPSTLIQELAADNSCITKYTGQVTDQVGQTVTANNVYFDKCADKRNIIFGGFCWQVIRTTETGGLKLLYNGEPVNGKCESTRGNHKGIVQSGSVNQSINSSYLYGSSFTYDTSTNEFTLQDTEIAAWTSSTYESLIGKFTCKTTNNTCSTLYEINGIKSSYNSVLLSYYTISDTNYAQIGTSSYNSNNNTAANVGYMFNKTYYAVSDFHGSNSTYSAGNDVSYANGTYTLLSVDNFGLESTHHYTCGSDDDTCNKVRYYYYKPIYIVSSATGYIELDGEQNIGEAINNMFFNDNVNRYNSSIKGIIDNWYAQNLSSKASMLEDAVFCSARNIINTGANGWDKDWDNTSESSIEFKNYGNATNLACPNVTDQFAVANNKAKLTYPVALLEAEENYNINTSSLMTTGTPWWLGSPSAVTPTSYGTTPYIRYVDATGIDSTDMDDSNNGIRVVVSLSSDTSITSGTGSETDPWIVE